jgi:glycosyltransferase involved in cell wall biosynthesis
MVVLHLISRYRWTGSAEPAVTLCATLAKTGVDSRLCCIPGGSLEREARERGVPVFSYAGLERNYTPWGILGTVRALARTVERERIDLIHAHTQHDHWLSALALWLFTRRACLLVRSHHETRKIRVGRVWRRIFNRDTAMNITPSQAAREHFIASGAMLPGRVRTIYGGLDLSRLHLSPGASAVRQAWGVPKEAPLIAHLSHVGPDRRQFEMLDAFELLAAELPEARLVFLGQGNKSTVQVLKEDIARRGLEARVFFSKDHAALGLPWADQVAAADRVVVLAVGSEGSSRGVMEAMAMGRMVIGARVGVLPELIQDGKTGVLVDPEPVSIAAALRGSFADAAGAAAMGSAAAAVIRTRFRCERQAEEMRALYREILEPPIRTERTAGSR